MCGPESRGHTCWSRDSKATTHPMHHALRGEDSRCCLLGPVEVLPPHPQPQPHPPAHPASAPRAPPGHTAELLHSLCSRSGPLHCVLYEDDTQKRVRVCQPSPQVLEHTLHGDHSSAAGSPVETEIFKTRTLVDHQQDCTTTWRRVWRGPFCGAGSR